MRFKSILEWYSGKSLDIIVKFTIPALMESSKLGYWKPGVSRSVHATLNKQNVAIKWARNVEKALEVDYTHELSPMLTDMRYGSYGHAPRTLGAMAMMQKNYFYTKKGTAEDVKATIERWANAFVPVAALIKTLDDRRPKPVYEFKTLSPTVAANVSKTLGVDVSSIRSPPMHGEWREMEVLVRGKLVKQTVWFIVIDWPKNTKHCQSRFAHESKAGNQQCEACGHAIRDLWNWVPILADSHDMPISLWVGKDCARKLFDCEVTGDAVYQR